MTVWLNYCATCSPCSGPADPCSGLTGCAGVCIGSSIGFSASPIVITSSADDLPATRNYAPCTVTRLVITSAEWALISGLSVGDRTVTQDTIWYDCFDVPLRTESTSAVITGPGNTQTSQDFAGDATSAARIEVTFTITAAVASTFDPVPVTRVGTIFDPGFGSVTGSC